MAKSGGGGGRTGGGSKTARSRLGITRRAGENFMAFRARAARVKRRANETQMAFAARRAAAQG